MSTDGSGKCSVEAVIGPESRVYGVLFTIDDAGALDQAEGLGGGYRKATLQIGTAGGPRAAVAYIADNTNPSLRPYHWYKEFVVAGAIEHGLPQAYVNSLRLIVSQTDLNAKRTARNQALLGREPN